MSKRCFVMGCDLDCTPNTRFCREHGNIIRTIRRDANKENELTKFEELINDAEQLSLVCHEIGMYEAEEEADAADKKDRRMLRMWYIDWSNVTVRVKPHPDLG